MVAVTLWIAVGLWGHVALGLELTPDLRCSACAISAKVVEKQVTEFLARTSISTNAQFEASVRNACSAIPKVAVAGKVGKREFIDFNKAMRKEGRGSKDMSLVNVRFGNDVTSTLQIFCLESTSVRVADGRGVSKHFQKWVAQCQLKIMLLPHRNSFKHSTFWKSCVRNTHCKNLTSLTTFAFTNPNPQWAPTALFPKNRFLRLATVATRKNNTS